MERLKFIKACGAICIGGVTIPALFQNCASIKMLERTIEGDNLIVPVQDFEIRDKEVLRFKKYIIVQNQQLKYPICVYRNSASEYQALWMRCTHQGTELQVFGDALQCPAHGSEFSKDGSLTQGPADKPLRTFPVILESDQLKISLKA